MRYIIIICAVLSLSLECDTTIPTTSNCDTLEIRDTVLRVDTVYVKPTFEKAFSYVYNRPNYPDNPGTIRYAGSWVHMEKGGSYPEVWKDANDTLTYDAYCYGFLVYSELSKEHIGYNVWIDGKLAQRVSTRSRGEHLDTATFKIENLPHGNHKIELTSNGIYVFNKLKILYSPNPFAPNP